MLKKLLALIIVLMVCTRPSFSQNEADGLVKWLTLKEAQEKNKTVSKPFIIDIYTDWCGWCKHMMKTTYSSEGLAAYINANFYPVKFNAETKDTIEYNGVVYKPLSKDPKTPHELAVKFLGTSLSYPSTMFVTNNFEYNLLSQGYLEDKKLEPLLIFMTENAWRNSVYEEFNRHFNNTFSDTNFAKVPVRIYSIAEVEKLQKKKPKKVLVNIGADFCNTCKMMSKTTFLDSSVATYINKNFYLVDLNATTNDTIIFNNEKYFKVMVNNFPIHSLALKFTANRFSFPALCLLDEQMNVIDVLNFYQSPEHVRPILAYIATNSYKNKNKTFNDFMQDYMKPKSAPTKSAKK
jgi:thioredoxin-related protein